MLVYLYLLSSRGVAPSTTSSVAKRLMQPENLQAERQMNATHWNLPTAKEDMWLLVCTRALPFVLEYFSSNVQRRSLAVFVLKISSHLGSIAGDDFGKVRLYAFPCVVEDAPSRTYTAHCSHVSAVSFAYDNRWLVSVGGADRAVCQWVLEAKAREDREGVAFDAVPKLTVLAPPPDKVVELAHVEYAEDGEELEELQEGVMVEDCTGQAPKVAPWVLGIQVVTSDLKYVL